MHVCDIGRQRSLHFEYHVGAGGAVGGADEAGVRKSLVRKPGQQTGTAFHRHSYIQGPEFGSHRRADGHPMLAGGLFFGYEKLDGHVVLGIWLWTAARYPARSAGDMGPHAV